MACIFCKIATHEADSKTVYEDEEVMAFLDTNPISIGHTLIIPKKHYENVFDIESGTLEQIASISKRLALIYKKALAVKAVNLLNASGKEAQQSVFHFHLHIVPREENDGIDLWFHGKPEAKNELEKTLEKIKDAMK